MTKVSRYSSFNELKSAGNLQKNSGTEAMKEYKMFIALLQRSFATAGTKHSSPVKKKRKDGQ